MFMTTVKYFERNAALCMWEGEGRCGTGDHCQEATLLLLSCCNGAEQGTHCKGNFLPFSTLILLLVSPILPLPALSHTQEHSLLQLYWKHQQALTAVWGEGMEKDPGLAGNVAVTQLQQLRKYHCMVQKKPQRKEAL